MTGPLLRQVTAIVREHIDFEEFKVTAPIAGAADRIRDALGGRHRD